MGNIYVTYNYYLFFFWVKKHIAQINNGKDAKNDNNILCVHVWWDGSMTIADKTRLHCVDVEECVHLFLGIRDRLPFFGRVVAVM